MSEGDRPHYHLAIFGHSWPPCILCRHHQRKERRKHCDCVPSKTWGMGNVFIGELTSQSAQYVAGYTVKKMTNPRDEEVQEWLQGREPEYARMSLKPGIGYSAVDDITDVLLSPHGADLLIRTGDVPEVLNHGQKAWPLGRYLRTAIRKEAGLNEEMLKEENNRRWSAEMAQEFTNLLKKEGSSTKGLSQLLIESTAQQALNQKSRYRIFGRKKGRL